MGPREFQHLLAPIRIANLGPLLALGAAGAWLAWRRTGSGTTQRRLFVAACAAWAGVWTFSAGVANLSLLPISMLEIMRT